MQTTESSAARQLDRCSGRILGKLRRSSRRWGVLPKGASLAVAVSGGIDSLALAYLVSRHNRNLEIPLDLMVLHVRLDADGPTRGLPDRILAWLRGLDLEVVEIEARLEAPEQPPLDCFACARVRRRTLLEAADARGADHLALGHHADDVVETWLLSLMYTGTGRAMPPTRPYFGGAVTVVRPMYELQRGELNRLARLADFPEPIGRCRQQDEAKRDRVRRALAALGSDQNQVRRQLYWAAVRQYEELR